MENSFLNKVATLEHSKALLTIVEHPHTICYLESDDLSVYLVQENGARFAVNVLLHELEDVLPKHDFFRCGWSFTINANMVKEFWVTAEPMLVMACGHIIPVPLKEVYKVISLLELRHRGQRKVTICYA
jgi:hypothetical protein